MELARRRKVENRAPLIQSGPIIDFQSDIVEVYIRIELGGKFSASYRS